MNIRNFLLERGFGEEICDLVFEAHRTGSKDLIGLVIQNWCVSENFHPSIASEIIEEVAKWLEEYSLPNIRIAKL